MAVAGKTFEGRYVYNAVVVGQETVPDGTVDKQETVTCIADDIAQVVKFVAGWAYNEGWQGIRVMSVEEAFNGALLYDAGATYE